MKLLLHSCCAPCLTSAYDQLIGDYQVTPFWFNSNIEDKIEHQKRLNSFIKLCKIVDAKPTTIDNYESDNLKWQKIIKGLEYEPESGARCVKCVRYRLEQTAKTAKTKRADLFGTTMTTSPLKNEAMINEIGEVLAKKYGIDFLSANFKKNDGYLKSIQASKKFNLYRQNYCGCKYSQKTLTPLHF